MNRRFLVGTSARVLGCCGILLGWSLIFSVAPKGAENAESEQAFKVATQPFRDELWDRADRDLAAFVAQHPESEHISEAILLQAQSRFQMKRYGAAVDLLTEKLSAAGANSDQYRFWIAEAQFQQGNFATAAAAYAELLKQSPNSTLRLRAGYGEAFARFKLGELARAIALLQRPDGFFQVAAQKSPSEEAAIRGYLLLAEALYRQKNYVAATEVLNQLAARIPSPDLDWQRQYLLGMLELASRKTESALARTTNLLTIATAAGKPLLQATSLKLQAEILEQKEPESAIQAYDRIAQIKNLPGELVRQAVLKSVDLTVAQNRLTNAIDRLQNYVSSTSDPADPALDLLHLTLGELHLKQYFKLVGGRTNEIQSRLVDTNSIQRARFQFDLLIKNFTNSPLLGKAYLNRGWCLWEEARAPGRDVRLPECLTAFQFAAERLTNSEDQAVARFKWADCQFLQKDFTNAIQNYRALLATYEDDPSVKTKWFDQVLYQIVRATIELRDLSGARVALDRILAEFATSPVADHCMILFGEALLDVGESGRARDVFADFRRRFPSSALKPEAELGVARSYAQDMDWTSAIKQYTNWLSTYTNHTARPQTQFDLALATHKSGNDTNALALLTDLVARYPASSIAPVAQLWIADYLFSQGPFVSGAYQGAEAAYQDRILLQNTNAPSPELAYQARLMGGRAAFFRQSYSDARRWVTNLISVVSSDPNAPPSLLPEAYFLWAKVDLNEPTAPEANPFSKFDTAISKLLKIKDCPLEPRARCLIGYCYMQLASTNAQYFLRATNEFHQVINSPGADIAARSEAEYLLASVLEKQATDPARTDEERSKLLSGALDHYLNVIYGKGLRIKQMEQPDLYWVNRAGLSAGALAEQLQLFDPARRLYQRLRDTLPSLREIWDKKLESLPPTTKG